MLGMQSSGRAQAVEHTDMAPAAAPAAALSLQLATLRRLWHSHSMLPQHRHLRPTHTLSNHSPMLTRRSRCTAECRRVVECIACSTRCTTATLAPGTMPRECLIPYAVMVHYAGERALCWFAKEHANSHIYAAALLACHLSKSMSVFARCSKETCQCTCFLPHHEGAGGAGKRSAVQHVPAAPL